MENSLKLGAASSIITPKVGTPLFGYWPGVYSTSVNDDLTATALIFEQNGEKYAIISLTLAVITKELAENLQNSIYEKHGISQERCLIHTTHTHSGPCTMKLSGWGTPDPEYIDGILIPGVLNSVADAVKKLTPVKMGVAAGNSLVGCNRRERRLKNTVRLGQNPWGVFDPTMTVISFVDNGGHAVASIVHYGAHCTASGVNTEITRDWAGVMTDAIERESGAVCAFLNGPEGDVGPRLKSGGTTGACTVKEALEHGELAAADALKIYRSITEYKDVDIESVCGSIELPLAPLADYETAKAIYEKCKDAKRNLGVRQAEYYKEVMEKHERGYVNKKSVTEKQTVIRIGDVAFVSFPYEVFSEIGLRVKQASSIPNTLPIALTNGQVGYFSTETELCRGGYEVESFKLMYDQPLVDNADWYLIAHSVKNIKKLKRGK